MGTFKQLGTNFGFDDMFLNYVGSAYAFCSALGRLSFGVISDKFSRCCLFVITITLQVPGLGSFVDLLRGDHLRLREGEVLVRSLVSLHHPVRRWKLLLGPQGHLGDLWQRVSAVLESVEWAASCIV